MKWWMLLLCAGFGAFDRGFSIVVESSDAQNEYSPLTWEALEMRSLKHSSNGKRRRHGMEWNEKQYFSTYQSARCNSLSECKCTFFVRRIRFNPTHSHTNTHSCARMWVNSAIINEQRRLPLRLWCAACCESTNEQIPLFRLSQIYSWHQIF